MPLARDTLFPSDTLYPGDTDPDETIRVYSFKIKKPGDTLLYTPANPYSYEIKKSGQGQSFNMELLTHSIIREEDNNYLLEEDGIYLYEEDYSG